MRQAHPQDQPTRWELAVLVISFLVALLALVWPW